MRIDKLFANAEKIVPFKKALPYLLTFFVVGTVFILLDFKSELQPSKEYYFTEAVGKVHKIEEKGNMVYFLIGTKLFLIKDEIIVNITLGDSVVKKSGSYVFTVYNSQNEVKVRKESKLFLLQEVFLLVNKV